MKAKPIAIILCYNFSNEKIEKLEHIASKSGIRIKKFDSSNEKDFALTIGAAVGLGSSATADSNDLLFEDEMLVMYNLNGSSLDKFLSALRNEDLVIPYKAVLTKTNMTWLPKDLIVELKKEHEQMSK